MSPFRALWYFDFLRCRWFLVSFWLYCVLQTAASLYYLLTGKLFGLQEDSPVVLAYVFMLVIIGLIFSPAQPSLRQSFFRARPVVPGQVLWARWSLAVLTLLVPQFISLLVPLLFVEPGFGGLSAFAVYYWSIHLAALALLGTLAALSRKKSTYLLSAFAALVILAFVADFSWGQPRWSVASPETNRLLWEFFLSAVGLAIFLWILSVVYRGRGSWKVLATGVANALLLALAWQLVNFRLDDEAARHPIPGDIFKAEALSFVAGRDSQLAGYLSQGVSDGESFIKGPQMKPPYWDSSEEAYWFISGRFEIEGLDPELAYSARLLEARWVAPGGEVIDYDRPPWAYSIGNSISLLTAPQPTTDGLNALLGEPREEGLQFPRENKGAAPILLFGAWTSEYERYKARPGRLEMRVRVDLFRYAMERMPLNPIVPSSSRLADYQLMGYETSGDELEVHIQKGRSAKRWTGPIEERWSNWMLYDQDSGRRGAPMGGGSVRTTSLSGFQLIKEWPRFRLVDGHTPDLPNLSDPETLEMIHIQPHYLGSTEVDVVVEDFPLVTERSIEWAERQP